jgi:hypothetical protein
MPPLCSEGAETGFPHDATQELPVFQSCRTYLVMFQQQVFLINM